MIQCIQFDSISRCARVYVVVQIRKEMIINENIKMEDFLEETRKKMKIIKIKKKN